MRISVDIDFKGIKSDFANKKEQALSVLKNAVIRDTDPYVPMSNLHHTHLKDTPDLNKDINKVVYDSNYASKIYKGKNMNFNKSQHPKATYEWLEASRAVNKKNWNEAVAGVYKNEKK
ncbi:minor capsid protein [Thomasclavelia cocleata]|uniref:minor capsid protein n=1 Tax=Thomasclavelia cocleata TaxID=69824 RepID=UPI0025712E1D|nr:minor capsid protein [Thomasclavelia cocleata]